MISVLNDFEIDRNHSSAPDLSFFGMESPKEEDRMDSESSLLPVESQDMGDARVRVSPAGENQQQPPSRPRDSEPETAPELDDEEPLDLNGFAMGDMVWGKVKSHPWWPGHIFNESFASPSVRRAKRDENVLVAFFGDSSYGWFDPAELISFERHFVEKSRQTTLRSFVRAVEESIDETGRRAALGIACRCQNPNNFRPTVVANYYSVDVVGYERNGIYSRRQINRERESFDGEEVVGFLQKLAVMPRGSETKDVEWHRGVALALALRRRRFEDFDETYAQAFGQTPVRPAVNEMGVPEQAESFAPRGAPLSGPLVVPEPRAGKKQPKHSASSSSSSSSYLKHSASSSSSSTSHKHKPPKKNKYVLKRRAERPAAASAFSAPLPAAASAFSAPLPVASFILGDGGGGSSSDFVLQKREPAVDVVKPDEDGWTPRAESPQTPPMPADSGDDANEQPAPLLDTGVAKKEKIKKRSLDGGEEPKKKKKKKKNRDGVNGVGGAAETSFSSHLPVSPPELGPLDQPELPRVLADLHSLALDPFHGLQHNAPSISLHVLRRFRSLVYLKSLVVPAPGEIDGQGQDAQASKPPAAPSNAAVKVKLVKRADDPTRAGRKRAPSDRQEESSAKRAKKVSKLKLLASEKKAALNPKASPEAPAAVATDAAPGPSAVEPARRPEKQEQPPPPPPPKRETPAFLVMKFPPRSTLPSVSNLKARFARFGPLEVDGTRVFWKSHSCRVQFKRTSDAERAMSYVQSSAIFGQIPVEYTVKEVEGPALEPASEPPQADGGLQFRPGNGGGSQPRPQQPQGRLKSILKKPGEEAAKESLRVKFMLSGDDSPPSADVAPPLQPLLPPPQTLPPLLATPARSFEPHRPPQVMMRPATRPVENRAPPAVRFSDPPPARQQEQRDGGGRGETEGKRRDEDVDISHQMLSLLLRCNDIVAGLRELPGFVPYRPL